MGKSIYSEANNITIYANDVVTIPNYPDVKWIVKPGWFKFNGSQKNDWYLVSVKDKTVLPLDEVGVDNLTKLTEHANPSGDRSTPVETEEVEDTINFYIALPDGTTLNDGDVVEISGYDNVQWITKNDWYKLGTAQIHGWFFLSIADRTIIPADQIDLKLVTKSVQEVIPEYRPTIQNKTAAPNDNKYIVVPGTNIRLYESDIIKISNKPRVKWVVHMGWYIYQDVQNFGWYIESIKNGEILPISVIDLTLVTLVTTKTQGSELYDGKVVNYTRPFTLADAAVINRAFITLETIEQRDNLDKKKLVNGKLVRVNDVGGVPVYYSWNAETKSWDKVDFGGGSGGGIPELIGTTVHPIILSELEPGLYRVKGTYKISPNYEMITLTPIDHITFVSNDTNPKIKVITESTITDYIVKNDKVTFINNYATYQYLQDNYATLSYVNNAIAVLEEEISEIISEFHDKVVDIVYEVLDIALNGIEEQYIDNLFN